MKIIYTKKNEEILVDDEDYERLNCVRWNLAGIGYASRRIRIPDTPIGTYRSEYMHRVLMGLEHGDRRVVDHINGTRTDNQKHNLRICDRAENMHNRGRTRQNKSGFKGVSWCNRDKRWIAHIHVKGSQFRLGYFTNPEEAYAAYCEAAIRLHGEFAKIA